MLLVISIGAPLPFVDTVVSAFSDAWHAGTRVLRQQSKSQEVLPPAPQRDYAQRIQLAAGKIREVTSNDSIGSAIIIDPDIATAEIKGDRIVVIAGLTIGSTILIISGKSGRTTYAVDVGPPIVAKRPKTDDERRAEHPELSSGSSSLSFTPGLNGGPSVLRYNFDYRRKLPNSRTLRMSSEMFRFFGGGDRALTLPLGIGFGANRLKLGLDSPTTRLDVLDSELEISPLGFSGYTLRGLHFVSTPESRWRGIEIFAGNARPQLTLFSKGEGRLAGAIVPLIGSKSLRIRSGIFFVAPSQNLVQLNGLNKAKSGLVVQTDVRYAPDDKTNAEGEMAYGNGGLSWRARLDLRHGAFNFNGDVSHLDSRSPMIAIGAQAGGRTSASFSLQWQPGARFNAMASYNRTTNAPVGGSGRIQLNSREFFVSANYSPTRNAHLGFSVNQQTIAASVSTLVPFLLNLQTRSAVIKYDQILGRHLNNNLEFRFIQSHEANTDSRMNRGISLREQLRYTWRRGSLTGFVNYRSNTSSLESLILRNPALLPLEFRAAFAADPQRFFLANRNALPLLLNGIQLPLTRNSEAGMRLQSAFTRLNVAADTVYSVGKLAGSDQRTLTTSLSANLRIDAANSVQVSASHAFTFSGKGSHTALTVSYAHRFGAGSGGGFQFSKLLGLGRGRIQGCVFMDLNSNGQQDPDEQGMAGMNIQLDGSKSVVTDSRGDFTFGSLEPGDFDIALISDHLGVTLRASTATSQHLSLAPHQTINFNFGLTNNGFIAGRVFNDLLLTGEQTAGEAPGLGAVKLILHSTDVNVRTGPASNSIVRIADGNGSYDFRNLAPGKYILEIDPATLPENFGWPANMTWPITISSLQGFYLDLPFAAQRAVSGSVYIDRNGNGQFDPDTDQVVEGVRVVAGKSEAVTSRQGVYLLRNLPAGKIEIQVFFPAQKARAVLHLDLGPEAILRTRVNLKISE